MVYSHQICMSASPSNHKYTLLVLSYLVTLLSCLGYIALNGHVSVRDKMERMRKIQHESLPGRNEGNYKKKNFRIAIIQSIFELE